MQSGTLLGCYCCIRSDVNLKVNLPCMCNGTKTIVQSCVSSVGCVKINCDSQKDCGLMAISTLNLFRTQATLTGKQKRQLQEKLEFVQEVVKSKKVKRVSDLGLTSE